MLATMANKSGKVGRPSKGPWEILHIKLPKELARALKSQLESSRRSKSAEVILALEKHLKESGQWPPQEEKP